MTEQGGLGWRSYERSRAIPKDLLIWLCIALGRSWQEKLRSCNPREEYKRLAERYPEVVTTCDNLKFDGAGQRYSSSLE